MKKSQKRRTSNAHKKSVINRLLAANNNQYSMSDVLDLLKKAAKAAEYSKKVAETVAFLLGLMKG
ncbi:MAG: hypothetical protein GYA36_20130 [Veillonellaceae bacterium]|nr:hypothetical protein [Veillonellaceae bacterium]